MGSRRCKAVYRLSSHVRPPRWLMAGVVATALTQSGILNVKVKVRLHNGCMAPRSRRRWASRHDAEAYRAQSLGSHWRADGAPKTGYRSQAEAQAAADNRRHVSGSDVDVYCCEFCQAWYMGNRAGGKHEDRRGRLRSHRLGSASGQCGEGGFDLDECEYEHLVGCGAQTIGMLGEVLPPRLALRLMCSASVRSVHGTHRRGLDLRHSLLGRERPGALRRRARPSSEWSPSLPRDWRGAALEAPPWTFRTVPTPHPEAGSMTTLDIVQRNATRCATTSGTSDGEATDPLPARKSHHANC